MPVLRGMPLGPQTYGGTFDAVGSTMKLAPIGLIETAHLSHVTTLVVKFTELATINLMTDALLVNTSLVSSYDSASGKLTVVGPFATQQQLDAVLRAVAFRSSSTALGTRPVAVGFSVCVQPVENSVGVVPAVRCTAPTVLNVNIVSFRAGRSFASALVTLGNAQPGDNLSIDTSLGLPDCANRRLMADLGLEQTDLSESVSARTKIWRRRRRTHYERRRRRTFYNDRRRRRRAPTPAPTPAPNELCVRAFDRPFNPNTLTLGIEGRGSVEQYQDAIRAITVANNETKLVPAPVRTIGIVLTDKSGASNPVPIVKIQVGVGGTVVKPFAAFCPAGKCKPTLSSAQVSTTFVQGAAVGAPVDIGIVINDVDDRNLTSAVAKLHAPAAMDELLLPAGFAVPIGLTVSRSMSKQTLTITGSASLEDYQRLLRAVAFLSGESVLAVPRQVSFVVNDGQDSSDEHPAVIEFCAQAGYFANATDVIAGCPTGKYQPATCSQTCTSCEAGKHGKAEVQATSELAHCVGCWVGQYQHETGASTCIRCEAGKYGGEKYTVSRDHCEDCAAGTANSLVGSIGASACSVCAAGKYAGIASSVCHTCVPGRASTVAAITCTECAAGRFSNAREGLADCKNCIKGQYSAVPGSAQCTDLTCCGEAGMQMEWATASINALCRSPGHRIDRRLGLFDRRRRTHYERRRRRTAYIAPTPSPTPAPTPSPTPGLASGCTHNGVCASCPVGQFQSTAVCTGKACEPWHVCGVGQFLSGASATSPGVCTSCPAGKYQTQSQHRETVCSQCDAGSFGTTIGAASASTCQPCETGSFQGLPGQSTCSACASDQWYGADAALSFGGNVSYGGIRADYCRPCELTSWSSWGACSKSCRKDSNVGTQTRARQLVDHLRSNAVAVTQCAHLLPATQRCPNTMFCPGAQSCQHLSCRFHIPAHGKGLIQVYHHGPSANVVHHCRMTEGVSGKKDCRCSCWNDDPHRNQAIAITEQARV